MNNDKPPAPMIRRWTRQDDKLFEDGLALYPEWTPDRWRRIAEHARRSEVEVRERYQDLLRDVALIDSGAVEVPAYPDDDNSPRYKRRLSDASIKGRKRRSVPDITIDAEPAVVQENENPVEAEPPGVPEEENPLEAEPPVDQEEENPLEAEPAVVQEGEKPRQAEPAVAQEDEKPLEAEPAVIEEDKKQLEAESPVVQEEKKQAEVGK